MLRSGTPGTSKDPAVWAAHNWWVVTPTHLITNQGYCPNTDMTSGFDRFINNKTSSQPPVACSGWGQTSWTDCSQYHRYKLNSCPPNAPINFQKPDI